MPSPLHFVEHAQRLAGERGEQTAFTWLERGEEPSASWTFAELDRRARRIASMLDARGLANERALLAYSPSLEFVAAFLGCLYARVVAVPLVSPRNADAARTLLGIARHADARVWLVDREIHAASRAIPGLFGELDVVVTDDPSLEHDPSWLPGSIDADALAFIQYTSGSTGTPKGVEVSHRNLIRNEEMIRAGFAHDDSTVFVGWLPLFHDMGLVGNVLQPLFLGIESVLMSPLAFVQKPVRWLRAITRHGGTTSGGPNFGYELCVKRVRDEDVEGLDLSSWRVAYNGSEPVRAATLERFHRKFERAGFRHEAFYPCYGLAEASLFVTGGDAGDAYRVLDVDREALSQGRVATPKPAEPDVHRAESQRLVGCGRPWADQEVLVVDADTREPLAEGRVGELWIRGGNVARGYRGTAPDEDDPFRAELADGTGPFLRTGDLGFLHDGELFVTGRSKDVVIQAGRNYAPHDIELAVGTCHPALRAEFTAAFTCDVDDGERLVLVQEVRSSAVDDLEAEARDALAQELVSAIRGAVSKHFGIHAWAVVLIEQGNIPKTSSGKIQRRKCRSMWIEGALPMLASSPESPIPHDR